MQLLECCVCFIAVFQHLKRYTSLSDVSDETISP